MKYLVIIILLISALTLSACNSAEENRAKHFNKQVKKARGNGAIKTSCKPIDRGGQICVLTYRDEKCIYIENNGTRSKGMGLSCYPP